MLEFLKRLVAKSSQSPSVDVELELTKHYSIVRQRMIDETESFIGRQLNSQNKRRKRPIRRKTEN